MLDHHDVLQGNTVVTSYAVMCASSSLVFPSDGRALGCVVYASGER